MGRIVGITCNRSKIGEPGQKNFANSAYSNAVLAAGAVPILLPIGSGNNAVGYLELIDGLLLPGGGDIEPYRYGQSPHPELGTADPEQDAFEIEIARAAWKLRMPIFAICRGIQVLNVALGGTLIQDIPSQAPSSILHKQNAPRPETTHDIEIEGDSLLHRLVGSRMAVNSFHHQAIEVLAAPLHIVARASDGTIEAVESREHPRLIAVQCHPEEMAVCNPTARALFQQFVAWL